MAEGQDNGGVPAVDGWAEQRDQGTGSLADPGRREVFWIKLRVGILDVLKELRVQEQERGPTYGEVLPEHRPTPDITRHSESEVNSDDSLHHLVQRIESHLVDHLHLIEGLVVKQEAQYERMQAFMSPVPLYPAWDTTSRQASPEASPRQPELVERNPSERQTGDLSFEVEADQLSDTSEGVVQNAVVDDLGADRNDPEDFDNRNSAGVDRRASIATTNSHEFREDARWNTIKKAFSERRLLRSRTIRAQMWAQFGYQSRWSQIPDTRMVRFVQNFTFQSTCSFFIILNAAFIGYQSEASVDAAVRQVDDPGWFKTVGRIFLGFFVIELVLRVAALRLSFVFGADWQWNIFDFLLVVTSGVEELLDVFDLSFFRTLRVLRMVRTLRIIRVLRFFRELRHMVSSVLHTLSSLAWALILLLLIMYLFSIVFMQAAVGYIKDPDSEEMKKKLVESYSTLIGCMYLLFGAISGGQDWLELEEPLGEISAIYSGFFAAYVFFVVFGVLNVLISVFVERASESGKLDRDLVTQAEQKAIDTFTQEMQDVFHEIDVRDTGYIDQRQFEHYMENQTVKAFFKVRNLEAAAYRLFDILDSEEKRVQVMDVDEFIIRMMRFRGDVRTADMHFLLQDGRLRHHKMKSQLRRLDSKIDVIMRRVMGRSSSIHEPGLRVSAASVAHLSSDFTVGHEIAHDPSSEEDSKPSVTKVLAV